MANDPRIHDSDPFATPPEAKTAGRSLRGRLAAPVTIWTAGSGSHRAGLTVSSVVVADGEPALVLGLVAPTTDLFEAIGSSERFVMHVLARDAWRTAEVFAGRRPSPGGIFEAVAAVDTEWGPRFDAPATAYCSVIGRQEVGYHVLVTASIDQVEQEDLDAPLVYFRGKYRGLTER